MFYLVDFLNVHSDKLVSFPTAGDEMTRIFWQSIKDKVINIIHGSLWSF